MSAREPFQFVVQVHGAADEAEATRWLRYRLTNPGIPPFQAEAEHAARDVRAVIIGTSLSRAEEL